jgi:hypothetical protein
MTYEEVNAIWDRADFAASALLREMEVFCSKCKTRLPTLAGNSTHDS